MRSENGTMPATRSACADGSGASTTGILTAFCSGTGKANSGVYLGNE